MVKSCTLDSRVQDLSDFRLGSDPILSDAAKLKPVMDLFYTLNFNDYFLSQVLCLPIRDLASEDDYSVFNMNFDQTGIHERMNAEVFADVFTDPFIRSLVDLHSFRLLRPLMFCQK